MAQLAINNSASDTTKLSPFFANFGKDPNLFGTTLPNPNSERALRNASDITQSHKVARDNITLSQSRLMTSRHKASKKGPQLKKGDKVYLFTKNMKTKRPTKKLDHVKVGPFLIAEQRGPVNYRLELPPDAKIHPVFHISLLEPADPSIPLQTTFHFEPQEEDVYTVERIVRFDGNKYLIRWKGYDDAGLQVPHLPFNVTSEYFG